MLLSAVLIAILASVHGSDDRIVGGEPAQIIEAPYQVALLLDYWGTGSFAQTCGGSIISKNAILTAAHCTNGTIASQWKIRAGSIFHNIGGQVVDVSSYIQHSDFNSYMDNDVALLLLADRLKFSRSVSPVTLPPQGQTVQDGSPAFITGWGALSEGGSTPIQLYKVTIPIVNQQLCIDAYAEFNPVTSNMICAGKLGVGGQDACQGDSGGPLTVHRVLHGVNSWSRGCAQASFPSVWTRVAEYRHWINQNS